MCFNVLQVGGVFFILANVQPTTSEIGLSHVLFVATLASVIVPPNTTGNQFITFISEINFPHTMTLTDSSIITPEVNHSIRENASLKGFLCMITLVNSVRKVSKEISLNILFQRTILDGHKWFAADKTLWPNVHQVVFYHCFTRQYQQILQCSKTESNNNGRITTSQIRLQVLKSLFRSDQNAKVGEAHFEKCQI